VREEGRRRGLKFVKSCSHEGTSYGGAEFAGPENVGPQKNNDWSGNCNTWKMKDQIAGAGKCRTWKTTDFT